MNTLTEISDEEFVPFLQSLGVDTYKKSFEWMLNDTDFSSVLRWLYKNLDQNNALASKEEYRYVEIEKQNQILIEEDLEVAVSLKINEYPGICLPGDYDGLQNVENSINMQNERLHLLEKHETILAEMIRQNELVKEDINLEISKLNSAQQQCVEDEKILSGECQTLADQVEEIMNDVVDTVGNVLDMCGNALIDKEVARKFFTFGPFESYRQSQVMFRSHFDLFSTKKFDNRVNCSVTHEELREIMIEAKILEDRLTHAILLYMDSKAELSGVHARLKLVSNYTPVHPSQLATSMLELESSISLLEQEESLITSGAGVAAGEFARYQASRAHQATNALAANKMTQINKDVTMLLDLTQQALSLDRLAYICLRRELNSLQQLVQFSSQLRGYIQAESDAVTSRIESMNELCQEQELALQKVANSNILLQHLYKALGATPSNDEMLPVKMFEELNDKIQETKKEIQEAYKRKEENIESCKQSYQPLQKYIFDGCTRQPNSCDRAMSSLMHRLVQEMEKMERRVQEASGRFGAVKNGDRHGARKLWQWFLTDETKLLGALKGISPKNYLS